MSDAAPPFQPAIAAPDASREPLTNERIEQVLGDFRDWLRKTSEPESAIRPPENPVDLYTLVNQFTGLRQEVNLQTKSTRSALEQNAATLDGYRSALAQMEETLDDLRASQESAGATKAEELLKPAIKGIIDVYDALALARHQVMRQRDSLLQVFRDLEQSFTIESPPNIDDVALPAKPEARFLGSTLWWKFSCDCGQRPASIAPPVA